MSMVFTGWSAGMHVPAWVHRYLAPRLSGESIVVWWEERRVAYNAILFAWGAGQYAALGLVHLMQRGYRLYHHDSEVGADSFLDRTGLMLFSGFFLQIAANIWYTGGWVLEWAALRLFGWESQILSRNALMGGTFFSLAFAEVFYLMAILLFFD